MYWCPKHVEHRRSEIKLNKLWHQVGLLFFNYHNDVRSNIHRLQMFATEIQLCSYAIDKVICARFFISQGHKNVRFLSTFWYWCTWRNIEEICEHSLQREGRNFHFFRKEDYVYNISLEPGHSSVYKRTGSLPGDSYPYFSEVWHYTSVWESGQTDRRFTCLFSTLQTNVKTVLHRLLFLISVLILLWKLQPYVILK